MKILRLNIIMNKAFSHCKNVSEGVMSLYGVRILIHEQCTLLNMFRKGMDVCFLENVHLKEQMVHDVSDQHVCLPQ